MPRSRLAQLRTTISVVLAATLLSVGALFSAGAPVVLAADPVLISSQPGPFTNTCGWFCFVGNQVPVTGGHEIRVEFDFCCGGTNEQWLFDFTNGTQGAGTKGPDGGGTNHYSFTRVTDGAATHIQLRNGVNGYTITNLEYWDLDAGSTDTQAGDTTVDVNASITLTGIPATIDFGAGVPGDTASAPTFTANVLTNNSAGYTLACTTSDLVSGAPIETVSASTISYVVTVLGLGTADGGTVVNAATALQLAHSDVPSAAGGDDFDIDASLVIPFVRSTTYSGTADFVASTL